MKRWRKVVHIEEGEGPHGGRHWLLELECGHFAIHQIPKVRIYQLVSRKPTGAPKKKRCWVCEKNGSPARAC